MAGVLSTFYILTYLIPTTTLRHKYCYLYFYIYGNRSVKSLSDLPEVTQQLSGIKWDRTGIPTRVVRNHFVVLLSPLYFFWSND